MDGQLFRVGLPKLVSMQSILSETELYIITRIYRDGESQSKVAGELDISQATVHRMTRISVRRMSRFPGIVLDFPEDF